jgi:hypothetical protein
LANATHIVRKSQYLGLVTVMSSHATIAISAKAESVSMRGRLGQVRGTMNGRSAHAVISPPRTIPNRSQKHACQRRERT